MADTTEQPKYQVAMGTIRLPGDYLNTRRLTDHSYDNDKLWPGDPVPADLLSPIEVKNLLEHGVIKPLSEATLEVIAAGGKVGVRGKWSCDPKTLSEKTLDDLRIMIFEIDNSFKQAKIVDRGDAIAQLCKDWDPNFRDELAQAPTALSLITMPNRDGAAKGGQHSSADVSDTGTPEMREQSIQKLAELQARANRQTEE